MPSRWLGRLGLVDTGQTFPDGTAVRDGSCSRCERPAPSPVALVELRAIGLGVLGGLIVAGDMCAECMADFVAGAELFGGAVWVQTGDGEMREVRR